MIYYVCLPVRSNSLGGIIIFLVAFKNGLLLFFKAPMGKKNKDDNIHKSEALKR